MKRLKLHRADRRSCGACTECCEHLGVDELEKPAGQECAHQRPPAEAKRHGGCAIYETRPGSCRSYACLWALGIGDHADRPDKSHVILEQERTFTDLWGKSAVLIRELRPGAAGWAPVAKLVREEVLAAPGGGTVIVKRADGSMGFKTTNAAARGRVQGLVGPLGETGEVRAEWAKS